MRILVAGLGSMGKRRIRLLKAFFPEHDIAAADRSETRRSEAEALFSIPVYDDVEEAIRDFSADCGFVCTPPLSHAGITGAMLRAGLHVFSEINLVSDGYENNMRLAKEQKKLLFLSSTPMYRKEIEFISDTVRGGRFAYRYHVGQYLPDWHPWESYTDFFVGDARTSGCREIFAIELPWLLGAFGAVTECTAVSEKLTQLSVDCPDCFFVQLRHASGCVGQLAVDVVSRKAERELEICSESTLIRWNGTPDSLTRYDPSGHFTEKISCYEEVQRDERYSDNIVENAYVDEMAEYFAALRRLVSPRHSFERDLEVLSLIDKIERSAR